MFFIGINNTPQLMKHYYEMQGEEMRIGRTGHATVITRLCPSHAEMKNGTSHRGVSVNLLTCRGREKDARGAPNAITRGASSRTEARWLHKDSRVFRWTLHCTESDFLLNWPLICFRSRTAVEVGEKMIYFPIFNHNLTSHLTVSSRITFSFKRKPQHIWGWTWPHWWKTV